MLLRSVLRSAAFAAAEIRKPSSLLFYPIGNTTAASAAVLSRSYSKAKTKTTTKGKVRVKGPRGVSTDDAARPDEASSIDDDLNVEFELPTDPLPVTYDPALDVGPRGRPLFSFTKSFSSLSCKDACTYVDFRCILPPAPILSEVKIFTLNRHLIGSSFLLAWMSGKRCCLRDCRRGW